MSNLFWIPLTAAQQASLSITNSRSLLKLMPTESVRPSKRKSVLTIHWKDWCWSWNSNTFGHLMWRTDSLENPLMLGKIEGGRRRDGRGWDGWMASLTQRIWVWVGSGSWWWTAKPGMMQPMQSQRVEYNWMTELNDDEDNNDKAIFS